MAAHGQADEYVVNKLKMKGRRRIILSGRRIRGLTPAFLFREVLLSKNHYCSYCLLPVFFYRKRQLSGSYEKLFEKRKNLYGVIYRRVEGISAFLPAFFICPKMSLHFYGSPGTSKALQDFPKLQGFTAFSKALGH